jgi:DNA-binding beta-propeller fold protein YncE
MKRHAAKVAVGAAAALLALTACGSSSGGPQAHASHDRSAGVSSMPGMDMSGGPSGAPSAGGSASVNGGAIGDIYAHDQAGMLAAATRDVPPRIYVPNHGSGTISVIDPATFKVIDTYASGPGTQHVVPGWDLKMLYALNNEGGNSITPIDPKTGKRAGPNIPVEDPYNMYFTPDGKYALVVAEANK